jgi:L,D-transpeptidase ErfK/SrfK
MRALAIITLLTVPLVPVVPVVAVQAPGSAIGREVVGGELTYHTQTGDTLTSIGARFGVEAAVLARRNGVRAGQVLVVGQSLAIDNRHIVPALSSESLVINVPQRMLFQFKDGRVHAQYPVGLGRPTWQTPLGAFTVIEKEENPTWDVPLSIQEEMRREGKPVITMMPPCPANPLGRYFIRLSLPGIGIHGTNAPASIYQFRTHGCIRLHPDDVCAFFGDVSVADTGRIIYEPTLMARLDDGRVFVEVHRDVYRRAPAPLPFLRALADRADVAGSIDWDRVTDVASQREGLAVDVTRKVPALSTARTGSVR